MIRFDNYYSQECKTPKNFDILKGFNIMAQQKGVKTWIKNLQEEKTLAMAKELDIDYLQGKVLSDLENIT
jgi:EAL domain-containing protein (putative c-di-GMP-specific phosphodiesterase class I)